MQLTNNIGLHGLSLYLKTYKALVLSDIHIGYEEALNKQGILVPRVYFKHLYEKTKNLINSLNPETIIINGDLKHEFGRISETEWRHTIRFLDLLSGKNKQRKIILIKGNHDNILEPIAKRRDVEVKEFHKIEKTLFLHGDVEKDNLQKEIDTIIIGHEHPAISLRSPNRSETYKCFLITKYKRKRLIIMPSFNEITYGSDIMRENLMTPFINSKTLNSSRVIIYGEELYDFGILKDIKHKFK